MNTILQGSFNAQLPILPRMHVRLFGRLFEVSPRGCVFTDEPAAKIRYNSLWILPNVVRLSRPRFRTALRKMTNQSAENTWGSKYRKKNDRAPPGIYEEVNTSVLEALPGTPPGGQSFPRLPVEEDFPKYIENRVVSLNTPKEEIQYVIVVLHGYAANQHTLYEFAKKHLLGPRTACIFVRGTTQVGETGTYCWSDNGDYIGKDRTLQLIRRAGTGFSSIRSSEFAGPSRSNTANTTTESLNNISNRAADVSDDDIGRPTYENCTERIGVEVITNVLIKTCGFRARDIAIVGHDQGGTAALAVAAACWQTKFGGVVSIGGPLPNDFPDGIESCTHVLLLGGKLGDLNPTECARVQRAFSGTIEALKRYDPPTDGDDYNDINNAELKEFVAHQLRREEWTKEAVLTFGVSPCLNPIQLPDC
jgi:predicted esterase